MQLNSVKKSPFTWRFLKFDHLFVGELRAIMDERKAVVRIAISAKRRLRNPPPIQLCCSRKRTHDALEKRFPHFWDYV